jgi:chloramphenicol O-acetyltransferase type A
MSGYLDVASWSRRELFEFFLPYTQPYFNVCAQIDVTPLRQFVTERGTRTSLALHYFALRIANEIEPFRYRLQDEKVFVYDVVNGGTTVLLPNESFTYAYYDYQRDFDAFVSEMGKAVEAVRTGSGALQPTMRDDVIYHTTLPWISFTSFAHARNKGRGDSIPRIVFGRFIRQGERLLMPLSVEVHHALMDGLDVGRYFADFEAALAAPEDFVR